MNAPPDAGAAALRAILLADTDAADRAGRTVEIAEQEDFDAALQWLAELPALQLRCTVLGDGRIFSWARQLRRRYGYPGRIAAVGAILPDQQQMLEDCGVDEVHPATSDAVPRFTVNYHH